MKKIFTLFSFAALFVMLSEVVLVNLSNQASAQPGWTTQSSGTTNYLRSVYFTAPDTGYVVGNSGTILKTTNAGTDWTTQSSGTTNQLFSVYFPDANTGYAVGNGGTIHKTTNAGTDWSALSSGTTNYLNSVYFTDANTGYAVGEGGTILKTTNAGTDWTAQSSGTTHHLFSIYFTDANTGYIVGTYGTILKTTNAGTNWTAQTSGTNDLLSVYFTDVSTGYAVGDYGTILKTTNAGIDWIAQISGTSNFLFSVYFTAPNTGYAVGLSGTILKTSNAGTNWTAQTSGTTNDLWSIYFIPQSGTNTGYIVGGNGTILKTTTGGEPTIIVSYTLTEPSCYGDNNGEIKVTVSGVLPPPFLYEWSVPAPADSNHISGLYAGTYYLTVTQPDSGVSLVDTILLNGHTPVLIQLFPHNVSCSGRNDGKIDMLVSGGVGPYAFTWSNGDTIQNIDSLLTGTYKVTVTDSLGCPEYGQDTIRAFINISTIDTITQVGCWGGWSGKLNITAYGGIFPYTFEWNTPDSIFIDTANVHSIIDTLHIGNFILTLTDSAGCSITKTYTLTQPVPLSIGTTHVDNLCYGGNSGSISVWALGGAGSYSFSWSNGMNGAAISNLAAGNYTVVVLDMHGCIVTETIDISQPYKGILVSADVTDVSCRDQHDGYVQVTFIDNIVPPFTYLWSNGQTVNNINNLNGGTYFLTVTDANNCVSTDTFKINVPDIDCIEIYTCFSPNNDGVNDVWNIKNIQLYQGCEVTIFNQWNQLLFNSKGYASPWDGKYNGNEMPAAVYYYVITLGDTRYKPYTGSVTILK
ncbi:MAG: gliding motility-associated C-terminal domain-containing protein [Bacteroidia bacterium]|nr:gliding motility-associated C-terminal domain-containing protein [Bacteroidia bacterium]